MKCKIPEISWHNRDPVLSVDIQPKSGGATVGNFYRLASGGTDSHVLIWYVSFAENGSELVLDVAADLTRHQRAVNVVKWSPSGELLASGDDESVIFIWKLKAESEPLNILDTASDQDKEIWITLKVLRGHMEDVYDLSWCPNSLYLVSGSVDNSAIIWDVHKGKSLSILNDHKGFVQGVAWDPRNQYIATLSTDRYLRIFDIQTKKVLHRISKASLPVPQGNELFGKRMRIYHDDTLQTFFRRLCFTPDGKMLITPAGVTDYEGVTHPLHTSYIYSRYALKQPAIVLPCPDQYTVAVKCCPLLFKLRPHNEDTNTPVIPLPYRMIFAIATRSSVYLYDTQQKQPFGIISNIHYTRLTDITWSSDGCIIVVSSTDGFCSLITFEPGELGEEYEESAAILTKMMEENPVKEKKLKKSKENDAKRKPSLDEDKLKEDTKKSTDEQTPITQIATPIAVKRKERKLSSVAEKSSEGNDTNNKASSIAIKCKVAEHKNNANDIESNLNIKPQDVAPITSKLLLNESIAAEIIIDKEILSSDEKFESPEKKSRPVTPISVRRHPRTPSSTPSQSSTTPSSSTVSNIKNIQSTENSPRQTKRATPIAVRRTPRALIATAPTPIDRTSFVDEAMDAWPLSEEEPKEAESKKHDAIIETIQKADKVSNNQIETTTDRTEDMRLVYEDTVEEAMTKEKNNDDIEKKINAAEIIAEVEITAPSTPKQIQLNASNKTPRRVALTTISTPKSKKKLLD